jgi:hypothetical protein
MQTGPKRRLMLTFSKLESAVFLHFDDVKTTDLSFGQLLAWDLSWWEQGSIS